LVCSGSFEAALHGVKEVDLKTVVQHSQGEAKSEGRVAAAQRREPQQSPPQSQRKPRAAAERAAKSAQSRRALREATARAVRAHSVTQPFRSQPVPGWPELKRGLGLEWHTRSASRNAASLREAIS